MTTDELHLDEPAPAGLRPGANATTHRTARSGEVLDLVRSGAAATTTELATAMGLARSTVSERVKVLLDHGLLTTSDEGATARRGRRPTVLGFNARAGYCLAAQLGMSGTRVGVTDLKGEVLWSETVSLDIQKGPAAVLEVLEREFDRALTELGEERGRIHGIGLGVPGKVELSSSQTGSLVHAELAWSDYPISQRLSDTFGGPVYLDQDVNLLALAEHRACWSDVDVMMFVKVGTVIGCGLMVNGQVVRGSYGLAGEIGHTHVPGSDAECPCGNRGCLNAAAGGGAIAQSLRAMGFDAPSSRDVARLATTGSVEARQAVREAGRVIGEVLAGAINLLNPGVISFWGYLADAGDQLFAGMNESIHRYAVPIANRNLRIERARLGDDAGIRGAALMVVERTLMPGEVDRYLSQRAQAI